MAKNSDAPQSAEPQIITSGTVQAKLVEVSQTLGMKKDSCSAEEYGALIFLALFELGAIPRESLAPAMQAWNYIPKNPSAMRQMLNKEEKTTSPQGSSLLGKYLSGGQAAGE